VFTYTELEEIMNKLIQEQTLLQNALQSFRASAGITARPANARQRQNAVPEQSALLTLGVKGYEQTFAALVKPRLTNEGLGHVVAEFKRHAALPRLLVTHYVTPPQTEKLRQANVQFVDAAGNAFLNQPPLYVLVAGKRPPVSQVPNKTTRAFTTAGVKVVFVLLACPSLLTAPYREIAATAGVSLGAVSQVLEDLKQTGYLLKHAAKGRLWQKPAELMRRWSEAYSERLRPKLLLGRFRADQPDWWKEVQLPGLQACWGGEVAAAKLTKYLKPQIKTIYAPGKRPRLQAQFGFYPDQAGDIELLKKFWTLDPLPTHPDVAPALLVYADLLATGDERNLATAQLLYDRYLA
jgi:hypothetical protein